LLIDIDNEAGPRVSTIYPDPESGAAVKLNDIIKVQFDQNIDFQSLTNQIQLSSARAGNLNFQADDYNVKTIKITPQNWLPALDTITVTLLPGILSLDQIPIDGNGNGDPDGVEADKVEFSFTTGMAGDYNLDNAISIQDFSSMKSAWLAPSPNYTFELAPLTGTFPYLTITPDKRYNLSDLMALAGMWNWFQANGPLTAPILAKETKITENPHILLSSNYERNGVWNATMLDGFRLQLLLDERLPMDAVEIQIHYDPQHLDFDTLIFHPLLKSSQVMKLSRPDEQAGRISIALMTMENQNPLITAEPVAEIAFHTLSEGETDFSSVSEYRPLDTKSAFQQENQVRTFDTAPPVPAIFNLAQNFPNPFNATTTLRFELPESADLQLNIYNVKGQLVRSLLHKQMPAGYHQIYWDGLDEQGRSLSSGIYLYRLCTPTYIKTKKMVLMK
jgi:hypothetical protein